jgi:Right handed beta helix region/Secretion system C-terminal sorting domain
MNRKMIFFVVFSCIQFSAWSTNYYFSTSGTNTNTNSSSSANPLAFNSFSSISLQPGDTIFLKSGDIFRGQMTINASGSSTKPIVITAYGTGAAPIISGSEIINNFTQATNSIFPAGKVYKAFYNTNSVKNLIVNGVQMNIAQTPNSDAATAFETVNANSGQSKTGFKSNFSVVGAGTNWVGAKVCVRTSLWTWDNRTVENMIGSDSINYISKPTSQPGAGTNGSLGFSGHGFFFYNKKEFIDQPGEWCYNGVDTIYYYPKNGQLPSNQTIEATVRKYGIYASEKSFINISNISFQNQDSAGVFFNRRGNSNIVIRNCVFKNQNFYGAKLSGNNVLFTSNTITDVNGRGLHFDSCSNSEASHNQFRRIGMYRNMGFNTDEDNLTAFAAFSSNNTWIHHNNIDSTGYCGIRCDGDSTTNASLVEKNILSNCMLLTTDGAALKTWGPNSRAIYYKNNFVSNVLGNNLGAATNSFHTPGIYFDVYASNGRIENNTIEINSSSTSNGNGIYNNGNKGMIIKRNIVFGGIQEGLFINDRFSDTRYMITGDSLYYNVFFGKGATYIQTKETSVNTNNPASINFGKSDSNYFFNPYSTSKIRCRRSTGFLTNPVTIDYTLPNWISTIGKDLATKENSFTWSSGIDSSYLFKNPTDRDSTIILDGYQYNDLDGNKVSTSFILAAWTSRVLIKTASLVTAVPNYSTDVKFQVFPNPAINRIKVDLTGQKNLTYLSIIGVDGKIYQTKTLNAQSLATNKVFEFDISYLPKGIYVVVTNQQRGKFIKL